jgi:hypothetical protein
MDDAFDSEKGKKRKRDGMKRADDGAHEEWKRLYQIAITVTAAHKQYFTTDETNRFMRENHPNVTTPDARAIGARMTEAAKAEVIEKFNEPFFPSAQVSCHSRPKQRWWSRIYRGPNPRQKPVRPPPLDPDE